MPQGVIFLGCLLPWTVPKTCCCQLTYFGSYISGVRTGQTKLPGLYCKTYCTGLDTSTINLLLVLVEFLSSLSSFVSVCFVLLFYFTSIFSRNRSLSEITQTIILVYFLEGVLGRKVRITLVCTKWPEKVPELFISMINIVTSL